MTSRKGLLRWLSALIIIGFISAHWGCLSKVDRACNGDADCVALHPKIFCFEGTCSQQACKPGASRSCYSGRDGSADKGICRAGQQTCNAQGLWSNCYGEVLPGVEICDQQDNDCDGEVDEPPPGESKDWCKCDRPADERVCYSGAAATEGKGECGPGIQICRKNYFWGPCLGEVRPAREVCDQRDNDCNGKVDDSPLCACEPGTTQSCFTGPSKHVARGICKAGTQTCTDDRIWGLCEGEVKAKKDETCDNDTDDNCDGQIDEGCAKSCTGATPDVCERTCVNLQDDPDNCGGCGKKIADGQRCCAGIAAYIQADDSHCGACGNACNASERCVNGSCEARCSGALPDLCKGTCVNQQTDDAHCGGCDKACKSSERCIQGACKPRCSGSYPTLCGEQCVDQKTDPRHCGACDKQCKDSESCIEGECKPFCPPPYTLNCNGTCVDPQTDNENCGTCGNSCASQGQFCEQGQCTQCKSTQAKCGNSCCAPGLSCCDGACVDLKNHPQHCGGCGAACGAQESCSGSQCGCNNGDMRFCYTGKQSELGKGRCKAGLQTCLSGSWSKCEGDIKPAQEQCNGVDDDCDGSIDNNPQLTRMCPQQGVCSGSQPKCNGGIQVCDATGFEPVEQTCDGLDNDCDGQVDEGLQGKGPACAKQSGVCQGATQRCVLGQWSGCDALGYEDNESRCDGLDNDCDGTVDENCTSCIATHQAIDLPLPSGGGVNGIQSIAIHPNGLWMAFGLGNAQLWLWANGGYLHKLSANGPVFAVGFTPDGKHIISVTTGNAQVREVLSGTLVATLRPPTGKTFGKVLAISPNNRYLALAQSGSGAAQDIGFWDLQQKKRVATLTGHTSQIHSLDFNRQGTMLASASKDRSVRIWDSQSYMLIKALSGLDNEANAVRFIPGRDLLATGTGKGFTAGKLQLWDTKTWQAVASLPETNGPSKGLGTQASIQAIDASFDGKLLYVAGNQPDYSIRVWDITDLKSIRLRRSLRGMRYGLLQMHASVDSKTLIAANTLEVRRWQCPQSCTFNASLSGSNPRLSSAHPGGALTDLSLQTDNRYLYTSGQDKKTRVWSGTTFQVAESTLTTSYVAVQSRMRMYVHPPGPFVTAAASSLFFWERLVPSAVQTKVSGVQFSLTTTNPIKKLIYNPNDIGIAAATTGKTIARFNGATSKRPSLSTLEEINAIAYSSNGRYIASGDTGGNVEIWQDVDDTKVTALGPFLIGANIAPIKAIAFHPTDASKLAIAYGQKVEIWEISTTPKKLLDIGGTNGHTADITSMAWAPDGALLATGSLDVSVRLWNATTGAHALTLPTRTNARPITHLVWSSDGRKIVAGTDAGQFKVWLGSSCTIQ